MTTPDADVHEVGNETGTAHKHRNRKVWVGLVAAVALTGAVLGAFALLDDTDEPSKPAVSPALTLAQLHGIWRVDDSEWLWRFTSDGRVVVSNQPDILSTAVPADAASVRPAPGGFDMVDPAQPSCTSRWVATISAEGRMSASEPPETAACPGEDGVVGAGARWALTRVSPLSTAGGVAEPSGEAMPPEKVRLEDQEVLQGTWLLRGTGLILTLTKNEYPLDKYTFSFVAHDLGSALPPRSGTMRSRLNGEVLFWPPEGTVPFCVIEYESMVSTQNSLEAKLSSRSCDQLGGLKDTWIRLN